MARPRVLVTGFGPFPGAPENPSAWLAEELTAYGSRDCELSAYVQPTEWSALATFTSFLHQNLQPHVMIHFGLSQRADGFRLERSAFNRVAKRADARAALPESRTILAEGPERLDTRVPTAPLAAALRAQGLASSTSRSAGRYLCNALYYRSLDWAARQDANPLVLFVHIPPARAQGGPFSNQALLRGAQTILRFVLDFASVESVLHPALRASPALAVSPSMPVLQPEEEMW